jgi:hypothetical protein
MVDESALEELHSSAGVLEHSLVFLTAYRNNNNFSYYTGRAPPPKQSLCGLDASKPKAKPFQPYILLLHVRSQWSKHMFRDIRDLDALFLISSIDNLLSVHIKSDKVCSWGAHQRCQRADDKLLE